MKIDYSDNNYLFADEHKRTPEYNICHQTIESPSVVSQSESTPSDGFSVAVISNDACDDRKARRRQTSWISTVLTAEGLSMFTATCTVVNYLAAGSMFFFRGLFLKVEHS
jgi:hypothetical protein